MSNVQSKPLNTSRDTSTGRIDQRGILTISIGPLIAYERRLPIVGMGWLADKIGPYGRMFWAAATTFTIDADRRARGLPLAQPILPWLMVAGCRSCRSACSPVVNRQAWIAGAGLLVSVFDYAATAVGLALITVAGWTRSLVAGCPSRRRWPCR
jgi:hypothetical protein